MKEDAAAANKALFDEYGAQPEGTRNMYAVKKLRQLNAEGYFNDNPFKKSFDWVSPNSVAKADRQETYLEAKKTGDWSKWRNKYGDTRSQKARDYEKAASTGDWSEWETKYGRTEKARDRDRAVASGDWSEYSRKYGVSKKATPYQYEGKFFKSAESMERYKEGKFWEGYAAASKEDRRKLLEDNPKYNRRKDWTDEQWNVWKTEKKKSEKEKARTVAGFAQKENSFAQAAERKARIFTQSRNRNSKKIKWS